MAVRIGWLALAAAAAFAQRPSFGIKAGVPASDAFRSESWHGGRYHADSGRYVIGPAFELHLPFRLSVELDILRRSLKYRSQGEGRNLTTAGDAWYFPLLGKYRLSGGWVAPYLAVGLAFERLSGIKQVGTIISGTLPRREVGVNTDSPDELTRRTAYGHVCGVGLEGNLPVLRISPEIRYTRWRQDTFYSSAANVPLSNRNQLEVLVGIMF